MELIPTSSVSNLLSRLGDFVTANGVGIIGLFFVAVCFGFIMAWFDSVRENKYLDGRLEASKRKLAAFNRRQL